jgi:hypothetical protein
MPWMTDLYANFLQNRTLHEITIPGTHDAGCYIDYNSYNSLYSQTQVQTIGQQLAGGIRYFDLRPYVDQNGDYWIYHGQYTGGQLNGNNGIFQQVKTFMDGLLPTDRELVILNISHFSKFTSDTHVDFVQLIRDMLANRLLCHVQPDINLFDTPYGQLLIDPNNDNQVRSRVVILYDGALDTGVEDYVGKNYLPAGFFKISPKYERFTDGVAIPNNRKIHLFDQYSNRRHVADGNIYDGIRNNQLKKLRNRTQYAYGKGLKVNGGTNWNADAAGGTASTLHLFSWTLTPQPQAYPVVAAQNESNRELLPLLTGNNWGANDNTRAYDPTQDEKINIVYVDHYASHQTQQANVINANNVPVGTAVPVAIAAKLNEYGGIGNVAFSWNNFQ